MIPDVAVDEAHAQLTFGLVVSYKPRRVLELGYGSGYITRTLALAVQFNGYGRIDCVDNWADWGGVAPSIFIPKFATIVNSDEETFLRRADDNTYDFLFSDANHHGGIKWFDQHRRVIKPGGIMVFHDTNNKDFPDLYCLPQACLELQLPHLHFKESSRPDERCGRGLLFVINNKNT